MAKDSDALCEKKGIPGLRNILFRTAADGAPLPDADLLNLLRSSPEKGFRALTAQYGGLVYAVVKRVLSPNIFCAADAEACAADTFSEFYLGLDRYDPSKGSLKAWLCVIARHNAADLARKRRPTLSLDEDSGAAPGETSPESDLEEREFRKAVLAEVRALDNPDREILLRKFYLGESSKEIAAHLGLSVSNVDTRTSRAVDKLRKNLGEWRK